MPQLNFSIPADLLDKIDAAKPNYLDRKGFLCLLLDEALARGLTGGLNLPAYCVGAGTRETAPTFAVESSQELPREKGDAAWVASAPQEDCPPLEPKKKGGAGGKKTDPFARRALDPELIPQQLQDCQTLLSEFWACKKGTRSQAVFSRVCNKLRAWDPEQRREALERAIASGWGDIFEPPSARANAGQGTGYVDGITRDRIEREKFLTMFSATTEAA